MMLKLLLKTQIICKILIKIYIEEYNLGKTLSINGFWWYDCWFFYDPDMILLKYQKNLD